MSLEKDYPEQRIVMKALFIHLFIYHSFINIDCIDYICVSKTWSMLLRNSQVSREQEQEQVFPGHTRDIQNVNS